MRMLKVSTLGLAISFATACSSGADAPQAAGAHRAADTPPATPPAKTVFDPITHTPLDRARSVQGTIDESAERTRGAVEREERGDGAP